MRHIYTHILAFLLSAGITLPAGAARDSVSYLPQIGITQHSVQKKDRSVELSMLVDLSRMRMRTQHTMALTPVLVSADGKRTAEFPPLVVDGKTRSRVYRRAQVMQSVEMPPMHAMGQAQAIIRRRGAEQTYAYTSSVPYERWMLDGRIELREQVHGCVNCGRGTSEMPLVADILPTFHPRWQWGKAEPEPEPVKMRAETRTARLHFRQDSYTIDPKMGNNQAELDTVTASIALVENNRDVTITGIHITGYASPEATVGHNQTLSENRSHALVAYIDRHNHVDRSLFHVTGKGEDWEGFRRVLDDFPYLLRRDDIIRIIEECGGEGDNRDHCEERIRALTPPAIYERLLNEVYPLLRRNEYRIEYNVRNFNLEEARRMINERPDLLSLQEMYRVAGSYEPGSAQYRSAMETAARLYPESPAVLNDRALSAMQAGRHADAIRLLRAADITQRTPLLQNTLGVALAQSGQYREALRMLRSAAQAGDRDAGHNLKQLQALMDQL